MAKPAINELSSTTLFVRGIPPNCSNETLSEVFSKAGGVKDCFVVKYKNANTDKPCIGYVTYSSPADAKSAMKMVKEFTIDEAKLKISFARKKYSKKPLMSKDSEENTKEGIEKTKSKPIGKTGEEDDKNELKDMDYEDTFTVEVNGLPALYNKDHVLTLWKKSGLKEPHKLVFPCESFDNTLEDNPEKKNDAIEAKDQRQSARFIVDSRQAALKAYNKLQGKVVGKKKNYSLKVTFLTPEGNFKAARKSRLIIRNLSFQCNEEDLKKVFGNYGTVTEVKIPTKPDGKKRGFGFVQFTHVFEATKAIADMNMKDIKGRKVAIDWSLPKEKYNEWKTDSEKSEVQGDDSTKKDVEKESKSQTEIKSHSANKSPGSDSEDDEVSGDSGLADDSQSEGDDNSDSEEVDDSDEEEQNEDSDDDGDDDDASEKDMKDGGDEENPYSKAFGKVKKPLKKHDPKSSHDVHEGRTVFLQNLSFDTTESSLSEALAEFGELCYAKIVVNHNTGMSKGCGFAQFKTVEDAKNCIDAFTGDDTGRMVDGREIKAFPALSRGDSEKLTKEKKKKTEQKEDKRNLHLGREGLVRPGTQAAEGLSAIELKKREKIENAKRAKLKNPNVFVSTTRLCVHNLPKRVDDKKLRELLMSQFSDRRGVRITECRVMKDLKNVNEDGIGKSLGYAFVSFTQHEHALKALRSFNNNPDVFGPIKRPIVEFSLENRKALEIKEQRRKKFLSKQRLKEKMNETNVGNGKESQKKVGRRKRQNLKRHSTGEESEVQAKRHKSSEMSSFRKREKLNGNKMAKQTNQQESERFPFQGSTSMTKSGKKLPLPAHSRPKIRHKKKGKILDQMRKSKKLNNKVTQQKVIKKFQEKKFGHKRVRIEKDEFSVKPLKEKKTNRQDKDFDALVSKYTRALTSRLNIPKKSGEKWYES